VLSGDLSAWGCWHVHQPGVLQNGICSCVSLLFFFFFKEKKKFLECTWKKYANENRNSQCLPKMKEDLFLGKCLTFLGAGKSE